MLSYVECFAEPEKRGVSFGKMCEIWCDGFLSSFSTVGEITNRRVVHTFTPFSRLLVRHTRPPPLLHWAECVQKSPLSTAFSLLNFFQKAKLVFCTDVVPGPVHGITQLKQQL